MVFSAAISLCYLLASQGAAFTSFKLPLLTLAIPQRDYFHFFTFFFLTSCFFFSSSISLSSNGFWYSFTLNLSIAISCRSCSLYTLRLLYHSILLYSHNILLPRNVYSHIYILNSHVYRKSLMLIFISNIP